MVLVEFWEHIVYFNYRLHCSEFEGKLLYVPNNCDEVLSSTYGDYMQLPPEAERVGSHLCDEIRHLSDEEVEGLEGGVRGQL